jgi:hypothetical protein
MFISNIVSRYIWSLLNWYKSMKMKNYKRFWSIQTIWISMISFVKHVLSKYHILVMKMTSDAPIITSAKSNNLCLLIDVKTLLGFECDYVILESNPFFYQICQIMWHCLMWFHNNCQNFEGEVYWMYCDNHFCFQGDVFINFHSLIDFAHENITFY